MYHKRKLVLVAALVFAIVLVVEGKWGDPKPVHPPAPSSVKEEPKQQSESAVSNFETPTLSTDAKVRIGIKYKPEECLYKTKPGDMLVVDYEGRLEDGTLFDSSYQRKNPLPFMLGKGSVIKGWDLGLQNMCIGEKRRLKIPPSLGYGEAGYPPVIPPSSTLIFEIELIDVLDPELLREDLKRMDQLEAQGINPFLPPEEVEAILAERQKATAEPDIAKEQPPTESTQWVPPPKPEFKKKENFSGDKFRASSEDDHEEEPAKEQSKNTKKPKWGTKHWDQPQKPQFGRAMAESPPAKQALKKTEPQSGARAGGLHGGVKQPTRSPTPTDGPDAKILLDGKPLSAYNQPKKKDFSGERNKHQAPSDMIDMSRLARIANEKLAKMVEQ